MTSPHVKTIADLEAAAGRPLVQFRSRPRYVDVEGRPCLQDETWRMPIVHTTRCDDTHAKPPGAQICHDCYDTLEQLLGDVPAILDELATAHRKDVRFVAHGTPPVAIDEETGRPIEESPLPWNDQAGRAAGRIADALPTGHGNPSRASRWALSNMNLLDQPATLVKLSAAMRHAHAIIERPRDITYVGRCPSCGEDLYAGRGDLVRCLAPLGHTAELVHAINDGDQLLCAYTAPWADHLKQALAASTDRLLTVSELVVALGLTRDQVKNLTRRLQGHELRRPHLYGHEIVTQSVTTYRLGDVQAEAERRGYTAA